MKFNHDFLTTTPKGTTIDVSLWVDTNSRYGGGYEAYDLQSGGEYFHIEGILEIGVDDEGDVCLTGYDGCFELPEYITNALEEKGVMIDL